MQIIMFRVNSLRPGVTLKNQGHQILVTLEK